MDDKLVKNTSGVEKYIPYDLFKLFESNGRIGKDLFVINPTVNIAKEVIESPIEEVSIEEVSTEVFVKAVKAKSKK